MIEKYFQKLENEISFYADFVIDYSVNKKIYNEYQGYISGKIEFVNGFILDFTEVKNVEKEQRIKYSYNFQKNGGLIFRYDNAPHHKEFGNFPHHKHLSDNQLIESTEIEFEQVLLEVLGFIR